MAIRPDIPSAFLAVPYNGSVYPGSGEPTDLSQGANCQVYAYALLRHFSISFPPLRSSELWSDQIHSVRTDTFAPLDLLLFNRTPDPYGAHVALYLGEGRAIHLSKQVGLPAEWSLEAFAQRPEYSVLIGAKRPLGPGLGE